MLDFIGWGPSEATASLAATRASRDALAFCQVELPLSLQDAMSCCGTTTHGDVDLRSKHGGWGSCPGKHVGETLISHVTIHQSDLIGGASLRLPSRVRPPGLDPLPLAAAAASSSTSGWPHGAH